MNLRHPVVGASSQRSTPHGSVLVQGAVRKHGSLGEDCVEKTSQSDGVSSLLSPRSLALHWLKEVSAHTHTHV